MNDYGEYRRQKVAEGEAFQDFVVDVSLHELGLAIMQYTSKLYQYTVGESKTRCEVKYDQEYSKTGNLFIETGEKAQPRDGDYCPSGIYRDDNTWMYIIGNYDRIFYMPKVMLRLLHETGKFQDVENRTKTATGFLLPEHKALKYAAYVANPQCAVRMQKTGVELQRAAAELYNGASTQQALTAPRKPPPVEVARTIEDREEVLQIAQDMFGAEIIARSGQPQGDAEEIELEPAA